MYRRPHFEKIKSRLLEARRFIQVISGPRQVGKTTIIHQVLEEIDTLFHFLSANGACRFVLNLDC
jgi:AAA+ ATPase superfamily predicted ATPase